MKELFKVLKDHNNTFMAELVESSYGHCFEDEFEKFLGEAQSQDIEECGAENVVRICLVDHSFQSSLSLAVEKYRRQGWSSTNSVFEDTTLHHRGQRKLALNKRGCPKTYCPYK